MAKGGGDGIKQPISLDGDQEVRKAFEQIGAAGEKAFSDIDKAANKGTANLGRLASSFTGLARGFDKVKASVAPIGDHFATIHEHATKFGASLSTIAERTIPNFQTLMAGATIGGAAGFIALIESTAKWGQELEENSKRLGVTPNELKLIGKAAAQARIPMEQLVEGISRFSISLQGAAEKQGAAMDKIVDIVMGSKRLAGATGVLDITKRIGAMTGKLIEVTPAIEGFDKAVEAMFNVEKKAGKIPGVTLEQFRFELIRMRNESVEARRQIDDELAKIGVKVLPDTIGDALRRGGEGFKDIFATLGVQVFDPTTNAIRKSTDALGDFLEAFKTLSAGRQAEIVRTTFGRGFENLVPIMQEGRAGLLKFVDAVKASGGAVGTEFEEEVHGALELNKSVIALSGAFSRLRNAMVLPLVSVFTPLTDAITNALDNPAIKDGIKSFALSIKSVIEPVTLDIAGMLGGKDPTTSFVKGFISAKDTIIAAIGTITAAFTGLLKVFDTIATTINTRFGTQLTGKSLLITAAVLQLIGVFGALTAALGLVVAVVGTMLAISVPFTAAIAGIAAAGLAIYAYWTPIKAMFQALWDQMVEWGKWLVDVFVTAWKASIDFIVAQWTRFTDAVTVAWDATKAFGVWVGNVFVAGWKAAIDFVVGLWTGLSDTVSSVFNTVIGWINRIRDAIDAAVSAARALVSSGATALGFASGGMVRGPGSGTSDSIHARLSDGEFVMRSAAVNHWGPRFLYALNALRSPLDGFANGGLVGSLMAHTMPRFADGGLATASAGTPVHLHLGGNSFQLSGHDSVVNALVIEAHRQQMRSAGTKPSWFASRPSGR